MVAVESSFDAIFVFRGYYLVYYQIFLCIEEEVTECCSQTIADHIVNSTPAGYRIEEILLWYL